MTLVVQSPIFLGTAPAQSHWVNLSLRAETPLPCHAGLRRQPPVSLSTPFLSNQAKPIGGRRGVAGHQKQQQQPESGELELCLRTRASERGVYSKGSFTQTVSGQGAAHLNIHTFLHLKTSLLYFKGEKKKKRPSQPFPKKPNNNNNNNKKSY